MSDSNDVSEMWAAHREESRERRKRNREHSAAILKAEGIAFESRNDGAHLIVTHNNVTVDFWPGTGKWIVRPNALMSGKTARGVWGLVTYLKHFTGKTS